MNTSYPYNRLQERYLRRYMRFVYYAIVITGMVAASMLLYEPSYAADITETHVVSVPNRFGLTNGAYAFSGSSVLTSIDTLDIPQTFTYESWVYIGEEDYSGELFQFGTGGGQTMEIFLARQGSVFDIGINRNTGQVSYCETQLATGIWTFVAVSHDDSLGVDKYYVNGSLVCTEASLGSPQTGSHVYRIGGDAHCCTPDFAGKIGDTKLSRVVRTQPQIRANFMNDYMIVDADTTFLYHFYGALASDQKKSKNTSTPPSTNSIGAVFLTETGSQIIPPEFLNGGNTGSMYFHSDKKDYEKNETVYLRWRHEEVGFYTVKIYGNTGGTLKYEYTGAAATGSTTHYTAITYPFAGNYQPIVQIAFTNGTFKNYFLGGSQTPNPSYEIVVHAPTGLNWGTSTGSIFAPSGYSNNASWNTQSGSIWFGQTGSGGLAGPGGLFAIDVWNFTGFGTTGNWFLDQAQSLLLYVVKGMFFVASKLYSLLSASAFFSFVLEILHPQNGSVRQIPHTLFSIDVPAGMAGQSYTVSYPPNTGNYQNVTKLVQLAFVLLIMMMVAKHYLFHRHQ